MNQLPRLDPPAPKAQPSQPAIENTQRPSPKTEKRGARFTQIIEPDWINFGTGVFASTLTTALSLKTTPIHNWLAANISPVPWLSVAIFFFMVERCINHFKGGKLIRFILRPPAIVAAALALTSLLFYVRI